jgi:ABC-type polysaccharide/polyol phosphate transport system ATPase subunit
MSARFRRRGFRSHRRERRRQEHLLKILSGITAPSSGGRGVRQGGLILGFDQPFIQASGRQNIVLNAALLGLSENAIREKTPQIIAFSELDGFIDQPVKTYSSGMAMRLGFAIATQVEPDVLIIDEALSVGDGYFQKKCIDRLLEFTSGGGTLLLCSHAMYYISAFCSQALWLQNGKVAACGPSQEVVRQYEEFLLAKAGTSHADDAIVPGPARIRDVRLPGGTLARQGATFAVEIDWKSDDPLSSSTLPSASTGSTASRSARSARTRTGSRRSPVPGATRCASSSPTCRSSKVGSPSTPSCSTERGFTSTIARSFPTPSPWKVHVTRSAWLTFRIAGAAVPRPRKPFARRPEPMSDSPTFPSAAAGAGEHSAPSASPAPDRVSPYLHTSAEHFYNPLTDQKLALGEPLFAALRGFEESGRASTADLDALSAGGWLIADADLASQSFKLKYASLEAHTVCNQSCYFCPVSIAPRENHFMPTELYERILGQLSDYRSTIEALFMINYNEPTADKRFVEQVRAIRGAGLPPAVLTNGTGLTPDRVDALVAMGGLRFLSINLSTIDRERYKKERGGDHMTAVLKNLDYAETTSRSPSRWTLSSWAPATPTTNATSRRSPPASAAAASPSSTSRSWTAPATCRSAPSPQHRSASCAAATTSAHAPSSTCTSPRTASASCAARTTTRSTKSAT